MADPFELANHSGGGGGGSAASAASDDGAGDAGPGCGGGDAEGGGADGGGGGGGGGRGRCWEAGGDSEADHDYDKVDIGEVFLRRRQLELRRALLRAPPPLSPEAVLLRDKGAFVLGLSLTWCMAYYLGWSPSTFYRLYTCLTLLLGGVRWAIYKSKRWHYYMLDFCYFANLLLLAHCWLAPGNATLGKVTFAFSTGPLTWSTLALRNSLVLHSLDKVTSVYMHIAPALVSWTLRWKPDTARFGPHPPPAAGSEAWPGAAGFWDLVVVPIPIYVAWAAAYYLKIFVISADRIRARGYATLFTYLANTDKKGLYAAIARRVAPRWRPPVYLALHLLFCCATMALSVACWRSFAAHTLLLAGACLASVWHGANYYFEFFSRRYLADLQRRRARADAAADAADAVAGAAAAAPAAAAAGGGDAAARRGREDVGVRGAAAPAGERGKAGMKGD